MMISDIVRAYYEDKDEVVPFAALQEIVHTLSRQHDGMDKAVGRLSHDDCLLFCALLDHAIQISVLMLAGVAARHAEICPKTCGNSPVLN